jgi:hypothetical protein
MLKKSCSRRATVNTSNSDLCICLISIHMFNVAMNESWSCYNLGQPRLKSCQESKIIPYDLITILARSVHNFPRSCQDFITILQRFLLQSWQYLRPLISLRFCRRRLIRPFLNIWLMVLLTYFSNYIQLNYRMFTNNIITITTVLFFIV